MKENWKQQSKRITELTKSMEAGWPKIETNKLQRFHEFGTAGHHYFKDAFDICQLFYSTIMPQVFNIPKVEHDQPCSTLVVLFFQISLFIYFNLGPGPIRAKNNVNKQTNLEKQNNQS